jgi:tRNA/rRNA methyltransferase
MDTPAPASTSSPSAICVVLVAPKEPGNVGSAARAMLNMGVSDLRIVAPRCDLGADEAIRFSVHARSVLENAQIFDTLAEAIFDRDFVVGTSAREHRDIAPALLPSQITPRLEGKKVAVVFGREESGLLTNELAQCQARVRIPTAEYASLNLAQAVLIVLYEFMQAGPQAPQTSASSPALPAAPPREVASRAALEQFYAHFESLIMRIGYTDLQRQDHMMRLYRKVFDRAALDPDEVKMFRGLWQQMIWISKGHVPRPSKGDADVRERLRLEGEKIESESAGKREGEKKI